jgi:diadenosine tetraphosphate (Ap4A) HIT family hydrolase
MAAGPDQPAPRLADDCFSCSQEAAADLPPRERVVVTDHWRVAHAFDTSLPGWLVVAPRRHLLDLAELHPDAAAELGPLLTDLTRALQRTTGCMKTYVILLAEAEGFAHLHFHVVPRMPDQPADERGPRIFARLGRPEAERVPAPERDRLAGVIHEAIVQ